MLCKFLHFNNNENINQFEGEGRLLFKINPIITHLRKKFINNYTPSKELSIDESVLLWKGRLRYKVYMPLKSAKFGIKYYEMCESTTGYVYNFFIYVGKSTVFDGDIINYPFATKVILQLSKFILNQGYRITMDNFFSSIQLFELLIENKTDCLGTMRLNRKGIPDLIRNKQLKKDESYIVYRGKNLFKNR